VLFRFETPKDLERWHVSTDAYFGGQSRASLELPLPSAASAASGAPGAPGDGGASSSERQQQQQQQQQPYATFSGRCSMAPTLAQVEELERERREDMAAAAAEEQAAKLGAKPPPPTAASLRRRKREGAKKREIAHTSSNAEIARAGYAVVASRVLDLSDPFDLSRYTHLVYAVRGDGGKYIASVRADSLSGGGGDVWQAPFSAPRGRWADVRVPLSAFALTHRGQLVERRLRLCADRVLSVGVSFAAAGQDAGRRGGGHGGASDDEDKAGEGGRAAGGGAAFRLDVREIRAEASDEGDQG
jgi:hypothetical protein